MREFTNPSAAQLGITLRFEGQGIDEVVIVQTVTGPKAPAVSFGDVLVKIDRRYFRPAEVETLLGDATKAKDKLSCVPEITLNQMILETVAHDLDQACRHALLKKLGHETAVSVE